MNEIHLLIIFIHMVAFSLISNLNIIEMYNDELTNIS